MTETLFSHLTSDLEVHLILFLMATEIKEKGVLFNDGPQR